VYIEWRRWNPTRVTEIRAVVMGTAGEKGRHDRILR
jgi:hypothetical protein